MICHPPVLMIDFVNICSWFVEFFLRALTLMLLWQWYVIPIGAVPLSFVHASGLYLLFYGVTRSITTTDMLAAMETRDKYASLAGVTLAATWASTGLCAVVLLIGWLIHLVM